MHYGGGAALDEVRVAHPLAVVEAVEVSWPHHDFPLDDIALRNLALAGCAKALQAG
jgi:hypothetical protein